MTWRAEAACRGLSPGQINRIFFPEGMPAAKTSAGRSTVDKTEAMAFCGRCPVQGECLNEALSRGDQWGIWGGLSALERWELGGRRAMCARCDASFAPTRGTRQVYCSRPCAVAAKQAVKGRSEQTRRRSA